jgi:nitrate/nitrite transport system substrate-binding protein
MIRWGQVPSDISISAVARRVYRPEVYRQACDQLGLSYPDVDNKREGRNAREWIMPSTGGSLSLGPDQFFDGGQFDPFSPRNYLRGFAVSTLNKEPTTLEASQKA